MGKCKTFLQAQDSGDKHTGKRKALSDLEDFLSQRLEEEGNRNNGRLQAENEAHWDGGVGSVVISWAVSMIRDHWSPVVTSLEAQTQPPSSLLRVEAHCSDPVQ